MTGEIHQFILSFITALFVLLISLLISILTVRRLFPFITTVDFTSERENVGRIIRYPIPPTGMYKQTGRIIEKCECCGFKGLMVPHTAKRKDAKRVVHIIGGHNMDIERACWYSQETGKWNNHWKNYRNKSEQGTITTGR